MADDFRGQRRSYQTMDLELVDALARLQLLARRRGYRVVVRATAEVLEVVELAGLTETLRVEPLREVEQREERFGVEEERELGDPAA